MSAERLVLAYEGDGRACSVTGRLVVTVGQSVTVGREKELQLAVRVPNRKVSRDAATIEATPAGWGIRITNRNGAVLHPWGQPFHPAGRDNAVNWPLIGIRMLHDADALQHWVLLVAEDLDLTATGPLRDEQESIETDLAKRPPKLSDKQREAVEVLFGQLLAWPPRSPAEPLLIKQAARRLGLSARGLQDRLVEVRPRGTRRTGRRRARRPVRAGQRVPRHQERPPAGESRHGPHPG